MSTHEYTIDADGTFPNRRVDLASLESEVRTSPVSISLQSVDVVGGNCVFTFRGSLSHADVLALEQVIFAHSGAPRSTLRAAVVVQPFSGKDRNLAICGHRVVCPKNTFTNLDVTWAEDREIQGAEITVRDAADGDFVTAVLRHPLMPGPLVDFGRSFIKPDGRVTIGAESAKLVPAGLILRITYQSTIAVGPTPVMYVDIKTWK